MMGHAQKQIFTFVTRPHVFLKKMTSWKICVAPTEYSFYKPCTYDDVDREVLNVTVNMGQGVFTFLWTEIPTAPRLHRKSFVYCFQLV